jgi:hypothetical protein
MSKIGNRFIFVSLVWLAAILVVLPGDVWGQIRVRPRPNPNRPSTPEPSKSARNVKGSVAQLLNPQGLAHYHANPGDLLALIRQSVEQQRAFPDTALNRSPWGVMHTTLAWGPPGEILIDDQPYNAIDALCDNQRLKGVRLLAVKAGLPHPLEGPGLQGHPGQLLAILAQNNVPLEHPLQIGDQTFTVADLVMYEKKSCRPNMELTFKLLGLAHYLPLNETWTADDGGAWSVERLLRLELRLPINGQQTCGGIHRLMAIYLASAKRIREGGDLPEAWSKAGKYTEDYHAYALSLINPDGSCSTDWLERRAAMDDPQRRIQTTGHILEWLAVSLPDEKLRHEKLMGSYAYLAALLMVDIGESWSVGPRAHALRALRIYHDRLAGTVPGTLETVGDRLAQEIDIPSLAHLETAGLAESESGPEEPESGQSNTGTVTTGTELGTVTLGTSGTELGTVTSGITEAGTDKLEQPERTAGLPQASNSSVGTDNSSGTPPKTEKPDEGSSPGTDSGASPRKE